MMKHNSTNLQNEPNDAGFSLLEMMVVAAILAGGMLLVLTQYPFGSKQSNLRLLGQQVMTQLRQTRDLAMDQNRDRAFIFDAEARTYQATEFGKAIELPEDISFKMVTANQINTRPQEGRIIFFGDSSSSGGAIHLAKGNAQYNINIDWLTGAISLARSVK